MLRRFERGNASKAVKRSKNAQGHGGLECGDGNSSETSLHGFYGFGDAYIKRVENW